MSTDMVSSRVLRGAAASAVRTAYINADLMVLRPQIGAEGLPLGTAEELEAEARQVREDAARVGYEDGFAAGRREATAQAERRAADAAAALDAALAALDGAMAQLQARQTVAVADVEQEIVATALQIAEAVLGREVQAADDPGRDALVRALALAPQRVAAVARLHPEDAQTLGAIDDITAERDLTIVPDAAVERGGCILDVGACRIDAQVGPALQRVREVLAP